MARGEAKLAHQKGKLEVFKLRFVNYRPRKAPNENPSNKDKKVKAPKKEAII